MKFSTVEAPMATSPFFDEDATLLADEAIAEGVHENEVLMFTTSPGCVSATIALMC